MKVIEQFVQGKSADPQLCEDGIFISKDFAAVIDGATSKSSRKYGGKSPGRACTELLQQAIATFPKGIDAVEAITLLSKAVEQVYIDAGILEEVGAVPQDRMSASVIIFSRYHNELWLVGDCQAMVDDQFHNNPRLTDRHLAFVRSMFIETELKFGKTVAALQQHDTGRQFILPVLERQAMFQNVPIADRYSYAVIDGFPVAEVQIKIIWLGHWNTLIIGSDGYPQLLPTLAESEAALKRLIQQDPLCIKELQGTKAVQEGHQSFDDRAYVRIVNSYS